MATNRQSDETPPPTKPQFGLKIVFLLTLMVAVTAAVWGGLTREGPERMKFLIFGMLAPFAVLMIIGLLHQFFGKPRR